MIPVKGHKGLYRDLSSKAIINLDDSSYNEYIKSKNKIINDEKKIENIENEIKEIKELLLQILKNK